MSPFDVVVATLWAVLAVAVFIGAFTPSSFAIGISYVLIAIQYVIIAKEGV